MEWSGMGKQAYTTAFDELVNQGYLIRSEEQKNLYSFYDKSQKEEPQERKDIDNVIIDYSSIRF